MSGFENNFIDAGGRSPRLPYLYCLILAFVLCVFLVLMLGRNPLVSLAGSLMMLIPTIRRLHDMNLSGWFVLVTFLPLVGWFLWLALLFVPGTKGRNRFGAQPGYIEPSIAEPTPSDPQT